jgi:hypothetical protein
MPSLVVEMTRGSKCKSIGLLKAMDLLVFFFEESGGGKPPTGE